MIIFFLMTLRYVGGVLAMTKPVHSADLYVIGVCDTNSMHTTKL